MTEVETSRYEEILARIPEVTWTTLPSPDHHDLAHRDEGFEQALRSAARFVYLTYLDPLLVSEDLNPSEEWIVDEVEQLRSLLLEDDRPEGRMAEVRWHCMSILGIPRSYGASSRAREYVHFLHVVGS